MGISSAQLAEYLRAGLPEPLQVSPKGPSISRNLTINSLKLGAGEDKDELTRMYIRATRDLWPRLTWRGAPPPFYPAGADAELARRFGTVLQLGITGGFYDMHMGHVVGAEDRTVTQYGHRTRVTFIVIDGIVTNGLQSWAWDDAGAHGGWQRRDTIVQVRPIFLEHAISLWVSADTSRSEREDRSIAGDSAVDWQLAALDSIAYLPGVAARLRRDGREALIDSLRRAGVHDSVLGGEFEVLAFGVPVVVESTRA